MSFSTFICAQYTRRLSRHLSHSTKPLNQSIRPRVTPQLSQAHNPLLPTRHYSTRKSVRTLTNRDSFAKVRFTREDIPPRQFWERAKELPGADLSAAEYQKAARAYVDVALRNAPEWRERFITVDDDFSLVESAFSGVDDGNGRTISAYALHYVALMLVMTRTSSSSGNAGHLAMHILHTLSGLDYAPSTLTLVRMALARNLLGQPQFEPAVERFERILKRVSDGTERGSSSNPAYYNSSEDDCAADACTLRAVMYERENTREADVKALRWFRRAYELGQAKSTVTDTEEEAENTSTITTPFDPRWQWKVSFALGVGRIRMRRGELEKARDMFAMASSELDNADGYLAMADVLEKTGQADADDGKYLECLEKAAISGKTEAAQKLGEREWDRAAEAGLSKWEKRKRQVVAEQWMAVAGSS